MVPVAGVRRDAAHRAGAGAGGQGLRLRPQADQALQADPHARLSLPRRRGRSAGPPLARVRRQPRARAAGGGREGARAAQHFMRRLEKAELLSAITAWAHTIGSALDLRESLPQALEWLRRSWELGNDHLPLDLVHDLGHLLL